MNLSPPVMEWFPGHLIWQCDSTENEVWSQWPGTTQGYWVWNSTYSPPPVTWCLWVWKRYDSQVMENALDQTGDYLWTNNWAVGSTTGCECQCRNRSQEDWLLEARLMCLNCWVGGQLPQIQVELLSLQLAGWREERERERITIWNKGFGWNKNTMAHICTNLNYITKFYRTKQIIIIDCPAIVGVLW